MRNENFHVICSHKYLLEINWLCKSETLSNIFFKQAKETEVSFFFIESQIQSLILEKGHSVSKREVSSAFFFILKYLR